MRGILPFPVLVADFFSFFGYKFIPKDISASYSVCTEGADSVSEVNIVISEDLSILKDTGSPLVTFMIHRLSFQITLLFIFQITNTPKSQVIIIVACMSVFSFSFS